MPFDPKSLTGEIVSQMEAALKAAYEKGVQDGIDRIVAAAKEPMTLSTTNKVAIGYGSSAGAQDAKAADDKPVRRAPRGLVPKVVAEMLVEHPGKIIAEYEQMVEGYDNRVSAKSVGNELRRHEDRKYRRNDNGEWFPMSGNKEAGDGRETNSPASENTNQGERYGTALV